MELYRIEAKEVSHGWMLSCPAFGITVDSGPEEFDKAIQALKVMIADEARQRLFKGEFLPQDTKLDTTCDEKKIIIYMETDFSNRFIAETSETVRRNISMPAWMDLRLRKNGIDASRLFQDAAIKKLNELERTGTGICQITDVNELENICSEEVLNAYFKKRINQMVDRW